MMILGGCASTKILEPNLGNESYEANKLPYVIAIDGRKLVGTQTTASPGAVKQTDSYLWRCSG